MLTVVANACTYDNTLTRGTIVMESDAANADQAYSELRSPEARNEAIKTATLKGMADPRINDNPSIFRVTDKGELLTDPARQQAGKFRARINVIKKLV